MRLAAPSYWTATRHPWAGAVFVLPLLVFYEAGLYILGPAPAEDMRNGADAWLRGILQQIGISPLYGAPVLLLGVLLTWSLWRRADRPRDYLGVWIGMVVESVIGALGLLCLSQLLFPLLQLVGNLLETPTVRLVHLATGSAPAPSLAWDQAVGYVGAGIYEETLFRLLFFSGILALLLLIDLPRWLALTIAALVSSLAFAGAHNLGPHGEPFQMVIFLFRTCAGLYFTWVYHVRGFGIAVGAHASYDVMVGLLLRNA
ncbi:MAG: CPBP family intramembrane metalloprotease [Gemmataceae bacterium]|nr:CPBP family intramembrane metalloprotease [Gemmataceae bacterium]